MSEKGFKGFNKALQCCPDGKVFQYEFGKTYEETTAVICKSGFHYCEHPLDVLGYYEPGTSRFAEVEALGDVVKKSDGDTKRSTTKIMICAELSLAGLIQAAIKFTFDRATMTKESQVTEENQAASATGYRGAASATGDRGAASATGYSGAASATGKQGIACAHGIESKAKAALGAWIVCSEWKIVDDEWQRADVKAANVDGDKIKADTFYVLKNGEFSEVL